MRMLKLISMVCTTIIVVVGLALLAGVLINAANGSLVRDLFPLSNGSWGWAASALLLSLPVPLHVISVGLILQRSRLSPAWKIGAWWAVVISGCWLGAVLAVKVFALA